MKKVELIVPNQKAMSLIEAFCANVQGAEVVSVADVKKANKCDKCANAEKDCVKLQLASGKNVCII